MKHLKVINEFYNTLYHEKVEDVFIELEDEGFIVNIKNDKIVENRDDWSGNFNSSKVINITGKKFITYTDKVILDGNYPKDVIIVRAVSPSRKVVDRENGKFLISEYDDMIRKMSIKMCRRIGYLELYGIHKEFYWVDHDHIMDVYVFAFYDPEFTKMSY